MEKLTEEMKECIDKIDNKKVISQKTQNLLKNVEYDTEVIKKEICENLED